MADRLQEIRESIPHPESVIPMRRKPTKKEWLIAFGLASYLCVLPYVIVAVMAWWYRP